MTATRRLTDGTGFFAELTMYESYATICWMGDETVYDGGKITKERYDELIADYLEDGWYFEN